MGGGNNGGLLVKEVSHLIPYQLFNTTLSKGNSFNYNISLYEQDDNKYKVLCIPKKALGDIGFMTGVRIQQASSQSNYSFLDINRKFIVDDEIWVEQTANCYYSSEYSQYGSNMNFSINGNPLDALSSTDNGMYIPFKKNVKIQCVFTHRAGDNYPNVNLYVYYYSYNSSPDYVSSNITQQKVMVLEQIN